MSHPFQIRKMAPQTAEAADAANVLIDEGPRRLPPRAEERRNRLAPLPCRAAGPEERLHRRVEILQPLDPLRVKERRQRPVKRRASGPERLAAGLMKRSGAPTPDGRRDAIDAGQQP